MSEIAVGFGTTVDEDPQPILLGGHPSGEHQASTVTLHPEILVSSTSVVRAIVIGVTLRLGRCMDSPSRGLVSAQVRSMRQLDELRFARQTFDTLER